MKLEEAKQKTKKLQNVLKPNLKEISREINKSEKNDIRKY